MVARCQQKEVIRKKRGMTIKGNMRDPCDGNILYLGHINVNTWLFSCSVVLQDTTIETFG